MSIIDKKVIAGIVCVIVMIGLAGCGIPQLSDSFDEKQVKTTAETVIETVNSGDYDAVVDMVREEYQDQITADVLEDAYAEKMDELGEFDSFKTEAVTGASDKNFDGELAMAVVVCTYENGSATFTLFFDTDYAITGIYMK